MGSQLSKFTASNRKPSGGNGVEKQKTKKNLEQLRERLNTPRLAILVAELQEISNLQDEASRAQIDSRQKRTAVRLQQQNVWACDDNFMKLIYQLNPESFSTVSDALQVLGQNCQKARDALGPLEQERMEAERRWEGRIGALQDAEQNIVNEFQIEFALANNCALSRTVTSSYASEVPRTPPFEAATETQAPAINEFGVRPMHSDASEASFILGSDGAEVPRPRSLEIVRDHVLSDLKFSPLIQPTTLREPSESAAGSEDIDLGLDNTVPLNVPSWGRKESYVLRNPELYLPELYDFTTSRERVNKWIKHKFLISRLESAYVFSTTECELEKEDVALPSNWSQLVIAYWALDAAADPGIIEPDRDHQKDRSRPG